MPVTVHNVNRSTSGGIWYSGIVNDGFSELGFEALVFETPSIYGYPSPWFEDGGTVSKLYLYDKGECVLTYDRGDISDDESEYMDAVNEVVAYFDAANS